MRSRLEIIDKFSTFAQFEGEFFQKWLTDSQLRRSMQKCLASGGKTGSEQFWALYWHKSWQGDNRSLAQWHLAAYLQEACYWAAQQTTQRFSNTQYKLTDYFQIAIAQIHTILTTYNPDKSSSLKTFAALVFRSLLKDNLRRHNEADLCTNWALLRKVSKKKVLAALGGAGLSPIEIAQYRLAWTCFQALYIQTQAGGCDKLTEPDPQLWAAIAQLYNSERLSQLTVSGDECQPQTIAQWLTQIAAWVRAYLYPAVTSLDIPKPGQESSAIADLPDPQSDLLTQIIAQEDAQNRQNQKLQLNTALHAALNQLDPKSQQLLQLYYQQGLTQQEIMTQMQMTQPTISRRLSKARESLLIALTQWSQQVLNVPINSNLIKDMSTALEEWLRIQYGQSGGTD